MICFSEAFELRLTGVMAAVSKGENHSKASCENNTQVTSDSSSFPKINAYKILAGNSDGVKLLGRIRFGLDDDIKVNRVG